MSYLVYARKYRPRTFAEVVGQQHISRTLLNSIRGGRLAHALIFNGPRGVGKTSMARILAKSLNCMAPVEGEPCGTCENCVAIDQGAFLDVVEIDAASNRGIDSMKTLIEEVDYAPAMGQVKVYIIDEFHMLTREAFNAFLKTLEEPPPHTVFVLATTDLHKVNPTILSRCQRHDFRRIPRDEMVQALAHILGNEGIAFETDALQIIATTSEGCMRDAESILDRVVSYCGERISAADVMELVGIATHGMVFGVFQAIAAGDLPRILTLIEQANETGADMRQLCRQLLETTRLVYLATQGIIPVSDEESVEQLQQLGKAFDTLQLDAIYSMLRECFVEITHSPFPQYDLEFCLLKSARLLPSVEVERLIGALQAPEPSVVPAPAAPSTEKKTLKPAQQPPQTTEALHRELVGILDETHPHVAAFLRHSRLEQKGSQPDTYILKTAPCNHDLMGQDKRGLLAQHIAQLLGRPCQLEVQVEAAPDTLARQEERQRTDLQEHFRRELMGDEIYQGLVERFQGSLMDLRVLDDATPPDIEDENDSQADLHGEGT
ncbi:DNA polymerase III subunit gamma/tau [Desulfurispirillum indicum]|uniref:DNA polymerase III subunit gamma/tau n=1 Tax=Desulfurispirillum indicum (strain ATCC BAA-1389 / DSM 22839 / S5) TaxID=653733 RepID=E6W241_DESIS|nr:DNA polymerase III subunit gamma/tau [Desulfurispirillum indicum]ADU66667.1 DNA polymerase III, subunits gamma and tau [Desulfurispirillum indicum S5]UCZ55985.1 DNA polymerase III subunit gamma/tau [Desulfurispirillum indicum]